MTDTRHLPAVEIEPGTAARAAVIWLHGLGADGHDFEPVVPYLGLDPAFGVRFVFPHAPQIPVTINQGWIMPAWYDIRSQNLGQEPDERGILESSSRVADLIEREKVRGVPSGRIVLAGFSQGGAIALHCALRHEESLAGVMALSTYLVRGERLAQEAHESNRRIPIFQAHGTEDPMVPFERGQAARAELERLGYDVEWKTYRMGHEVCPPEIHDIGRWLAERLAP